jgi:hypothetical protein
MYVRPDGTPRASRRWQSGGGGAGLGPVVRGIETLKMKLPVF